MILAGSVPRSGSGRLSLAAQRLEVGRRTDRSRIEAVQPLGRMMDRAREGGRGIRLDRCHAELRKGSG